MTDIFRYAFPNRKLMSKEKMISELNGIIQILKKDIDDQSRNLNELNNQTTVDDLELSLLGLYLQTCYAQSLRKSSYTSEDEDNVPSSLPCEVYFSEKYKAILIDTPVVLGSYRTAKNKLQENILKSLVLMAVKKFEDGSGRQLPFLIDSPFAVCLYRRTLPGLSSSVVPDIDNIEARKIINAIVREIAQGDYYSSMITNVNSIEYVKETRSVGTSILFVEEAKRLALEKEFLLKKRSFDEALRKKM